MNPDDLARFLRANPQFFEQNPELLESIHVPHPYGGRAIPLAERQTVALREKVRLLEGKLGELIRFGEENDAISEKVHRLAVALVGARDFPALAHSLYFHLREDFAVPHVALRVWARRCRPTSPRPRRWTRRSASLRRRWERRNAVRPPRARSFPGSARPPSTCARWRWCRWARAWCSACSRSAARTRSASSPRWGRST